MGVVLEISPFVFFFSKICSVFLLLIIGLLFSFFFSSVFFVFMKKYRVFLFAYFSVFCLFAFLLGFFFGRVLFGVSFLFFQNVVFSF